MFSALFLTIPFLHYYGKIAFCQIKLDLFEKSTSLTFSDYLDNASGMMKGDGFWSKWGIKREYVSRTIYLKSNSVLFPLFIIVLNEKENI